jgi:hypothetical protein
MDRFLVNVLGGVLGVKLGFGALPESTKKTT